MDKIEFTKKLDFNKNGDFFDDYPDCNQFYELKYLEINPDLHQKDNNSKVESIKKVINFLILEYRTKPSKIIDVGSGSTLILEEILQFVESFGNKNCFGLGVDISASILRSSPQNSQIYKLRANASKLPLSDGSFDIMLLIDLLEHTLSPSSVIQEALRVADYVIIKVPLELSLYTLFRGGKKRLLEMERKHGHIQHFNYRQIMDLINKNEILWESYMKIPNRSKFIDLSQSILLWLKFHSIYRILFGGFMVLCVKGYDQINTREEK